MNASSSAPEPPVRVLLIAGAGRSGSTLLDRLLGQAQGCVSLGEFFWVWTWAYGQNQLCGCGAPFRTCPFWQAVLRDAFPEGSAPGPDEMRRLHPLIEGNRYTPWPGRGRPRADREAYDRGIIAMYRAVRKISGARWIIDSSKFPVRGFLLRRLPEFDVRILHLVRDSRAVAHSWQRRRVRPETGERRSLMPLKGPIRSALASNVASFLVPWLKGPRSPYRRVRYEDLARDPAGTLTGILEWMGESSPDLGFLRNDRASMKLDHTVAGNPMRFNQGSLEIRQDDEWRREMGAAARCCVTLLTWPWLLRHGYFGSQTRPPR
ncbi:MAG: sulfotransferase [Candidatus Brocadiae bacterium]|nr:sulfotransferase [Candidatus Brocadiia bacterium]